MAKPRVVVFIDRHGRIVRYSVTQSENDKAQHLHIKRTTTWKAFYDFGAKVDISKPST